MPSSENTGYLVQLKSPEGENVYPIISAEMIKDKNGETYDLPGLFQSVSEGKSAIAAAVTDKGVTTALQTRASNRLLLILVVFRLRGNLIYRNHYIQRLIAEAILLNLIKHLPSQFPLMSFQV